MIIFAYFLPIAIIVFFVWIYAVAEGRDEERRAKIESENEALLAECKPFERERSVNDLVDAVVNLPPVVREEERRGGRIRDWVWPSITDSESAEKAIRGGYWAAIVVASATALLAVISFTTGEPSFNLDGYALIDAALFAVIAWRLKNRSRIFAVLGIVLFGIEKIVIWIDTGSMAGLPLTIVIALAFLNSARGAFAYHRVSNGVSLHTESSSDGMPELNSPSVGVRLAELKSLYEQGLVDEEVYQQKQTDILRNL